MSLGCRVKRLEQTVFGSLDPTYPNDPNTNPNEDEVMHSSLLDSVQSLVENVNAVESNIEELREVDLLDEYVDECGGRICPPSHLFYCFSVRNTSAHLSMMAGTCKNETCTVKELLVLAAEHDILTANKDWLAFGALNDHLDQDWMKEIPAMSERLHRLAGIHIQQAERAALMQTRLQYVLRLYNDLVEILNQRFISWDRFSVPQDSAAAHSSVHTAKAPSIDHQ